MWPWQRGASAEDVRRAADLAALAAAESARTREAMDDALARVLESAPSRKGSSLAGSFLLLCISLLALWPTYAVLRLGVEALSEPIPYRTAPGGSVIVAIETSTGALLSATPPSPPSDVTVVVGAVFDDQGSVHYEFDFPKDLAGKRFLIEFRGVAVIQGDELTLAPYTLDQVTPCDADGDPDTPGDTACRILSGVLPSADFSHEDRVCSDIQTPAGALRVPVSGRSIASAEVVNWAHFRSTYPALRQEGNGGVMAATSGGERQVRAWGPVDQQACLTAEAEGSSELQTASTVPESVSRPYGAEIMQWGSADLATPVTVVTRRSNADADGSALLAVGGLIGGLALSVFWFACVRLVYAVADSRSRRRPQRPRSIEVGR